MSEKNAIPLLKIFVIGALIALVSLIIILSLVPPVSKDALVHHLTLPKLYLEHGGIYEIPFMPFSYYPMNLDLLYMIPLHFGNDIAPKFIHFAFALLTSWLIFYYLRKRIDSLYGLLGAVLFLTIPIIVKLSITVYVDLGEIFFSFAALIFLMEWIRSDFRLKFLILAGIMCGLAMGTKYNGLVTFILLALFVPFLYSRYNKNTGTGFLRPAGYGIIFILVSLLIFSPWMIRNYKWKKNPVYPLYNNLFNPSRSTQKSISLTSPDQKQNRGFFTYRSMIYHETWWEIALLPARVFFQGKDGSPQYFDGKLNPFLFFLPVFAFLYMKKVPEYLGAEKKIMLAFSILFFCFALFSAVMRIRYFSPIIPPLIILSVFGIKNLIDFFGECRADLAKRAGIGFVALILVFFISLNVEYLIGQFRYVAPFEYLNGSLRRDEYIARYRPEYSAMSFINKNLDHDAKVLFIFLGKRGYYCNREYMFDMGMLKNLINNSKTPENILKGLRNKGMTHLLVYFHLFERWMKDNFSEDKIFLTQQFFKEYAVFLFHKKGFGVLVLRDDIV